MRSTSEVQGATSGIFQALVEQAPDAMVYADRDGIILLWNRAAEALFGHSAEEVLCKNLDLIIPERFRAAHWTGFRHAMASGQSKYKGKALTTRSVHKDGSTLYVDMTFGMIEGAAGSVTGVLAICRDCTERHLSRNAARESVKP